MHLGNSRQDAEGIIRHRDIYPLVSDDHAGDSDDWQMPPGMDAVVVYDPEPVACISYHYRSMSMIEIHIQILPQARGKSLEYGKAMMKWLWANLPVVKIVGMIHDERTLKYAIKNGFSIEGVCTKSLQKDGQMIDQTHIGIERCQQ